MTMRGTLIWYLVFLWTVDLSLTAELTCAIKPGDTKVITVMFEDSDFEDPKAVNMVKFPCVKNNKESLTVGQSVKTTCYNFENNKAFELITYKETGGVVTNTVKWNGKCILDTTVKLKSTEATVNIADATNDAIEGVLTVKVTASLDESYTVNEPMGFLVNLDKQYVGYAVIAIYELFMNGIKMVENGCLTTATEDLEASLLQGAPTTGIMVNAFVTTKFDSNGETIKVKGTVKVCPTDSDACAFPEASCGTPPIIGRKRREVTDEKTEFLDVNAETKVFLNAVQKEQYDQQLARSHQSAERSQLCMNKTVSVVVIVILIIGMTVCLLTTIWMFFKMRKARRRTSSRKSDPTYSNKSFKM